MSPDAAWRTVTLSMAHSKRNCRSLTQAEATCRHCAGSHGRQSCTALFERVKRSMSPRHPSKQRCKVVAAHSPGVLEKPLEAVDLITVVCVRISWRLIMRSAPDSKRSWSDR